MTNEDQISAELKDSLVFLYFAGVPIMGKFKKYLVVQKILVISYPVKEIDEGFERLGWLYFDPTRDDADIYFDTGNSFFGKVTSEVAIELYNDMTTDWKTSQENQPPKKKEPKKKVVSLDSYKKNKIELSEKTDSDSDSDFPPVA